MSYVAKGDKEFEASGATPVKSHKIRITLTSRNVKNLEKGKSPATARGKGKKQLLTGSRFVCSLQGPD